MPPFKLDCSMRTVFCDAVRQCYLRTTCSISWELHATTTSKWLLHHPECWQNMQLIPFHQSELFGLSAAHLVRIVRLLAGSCRHDLQDFDVPILDNV